MTITFKTAALALAIGALAASPVIAQSMMKPDAKKAAAAAPAKPNPATVDAYVKATFGKNSPEWQARIEPDETLKIGRAHV